MSPRDASVPVTEDRAPALRDGSPRRSYGDRGEPPRDERREYDPESLAPLPARLAGEDEPDPAPYPLGPGRRPRVGRLEGEVLSRLHALDPLAEISGQPKEVVRGGVGGDTAADASDGVRGSTCADGESVR